MSSTNSDSDQNLKAGDIAPVLPAGRQYIAELLAELEGTRPDDLRGKKRFPAGYELRYAPAQFRSILTIAKRFLATDPALLSPKLAKKVEVALVDLVALVDEIVTAPANEQPQFARRKASEDAERKLGEILDFFTDVESELEKAKPISSPNLDQPKALSDSEVADIQRMRAELEKSRAEFSDLEARHAQISAELDTRRDLVEVRRSEIGSQGAEELAKAYKEQATKHERQWKIWGIGLACSTLAALIGGYLVLHGNRPSDEATTAQIVSHVAVDLLIVGLLIYLVRVTSLQFSVHRHLEAVAHNKAAALVTFARIVNSGSSSEARDRLTDVLAQYVFVSDNTGFLNAANDQVTLPERLAGPIGQRLSSPS